MKEMIPLSLRQRKAFVWWARREYEDYAAIICDGAIRSGKTLAMGMGFFFWAMACFSDRQFALCGRSVGALLETVLPQLRRLGFACEEKRSEKLLIVRRRGRENRFYLFGGANEASAALIQGMTLAGVLFDEAALMPRSFVEQASALLGRGEPAVVQLQSRGAEPLVLPGVGVPGRGEKGALSPLHDGGQSVAEREGARPVREHVQRHFLPPLRAGRMDGGGGAHLRLLRAGGVRAGGARGAVGEAARFRGLRDGEPDELWDVGAQGRRVVQGEGILL